MLVKQLKTKRKNNGVNFSAWSLVASLLKNLLRGKKNEKNYREEE